MTSSTISYAATPPATGDLRERPHLVVALECGAPLAGASRHSLHDIDTVEIGRAPVRAASRNGARLEVRLPDPRMSGSHAIIWRDADAFVVEDQRSKNGVFVNGAKSSRAELHDGDIILCGETLFIFRSALPSDPAAPPDLAVRTPTPLTTLIPALAIELERLSQIGRSTIPILMLGDTGTGKEVASRAVHSLSGRGGDFVAFNCAALAPNLVESALFGHKRGAFSGATTNELGFLRAADRGTLLMDEIGDLPLAAQASLLRVLQEGEVTPVGSSKPERVDLRVIAATHRDVFSLVNEGKFREDLLARLSGFVFKLPPLKARREDIGLLVGGILSRLADESRRTFTLTPEAGLAAFNYDWPQNIRELEKTLVRAAVLSTEGRIDASHLSLPARTLDEQGQKARLIALLAQHKGNLSAVAKAMATSRTQVHRWLDRFDLDADSFRG